MVLQCSVRDQYVRTMCSFFRSKSTKFLNNVISEQTGLTIDNFYPTLVVSKSHFEIDKHQLLFLDQTLELEFNIYIDYQIL